MKHSKVNTVDGRYHVKVASVEIKFMALDFTRFYCPRGKRKTAVEMFRVARQPKIDGRRCVRQREWLGNLNLKFNLTMRACVLESIRTARTTMKAASRRRGREWRKFQCRRRYQLLVESFNRGENFKDEPFSLDV
jgi:hypothetical protein